jgi:hypothetical protein
MKQCGWGGNGGMPRRIISPRRSDRENGQIVMPTLLRQDGFDIRMYFDDHDPPHIHAFKAGGQAKVALGSLEVAPSLIMVQGMSAKEAKKAIALVMEYQTQFLEKWEEYHG